MKKIILWVWQLPQNILGFILTRKPKATGTYLCNDGKLVKVYFTSNVFNCGVSLGNYIILDYDSYCYGGYCECLSANVLNHERGHQKQSLYLGWLYLPVIGITSALCNNLYDRIFHCKWSAKERNCWYYSRFPEKWADELGGVKR